MLAERLRRAIELPIESKMLICAGDDILFGSDDSLVPAAVLIAVTDRPDPGVLLTVRNANMRNHAGQIAFPGGRIDPSDGGAMAAALREADEEIGLDPSQVQLIGTTDLYRTGTGFIITPVIGIVPPDMALDPHVAEVDAIFETPLEYLLDLGNHLEREQEYNGQMRRFREILWRDYRIWGATAGIIHNLANRIDRQG